MGFLIHGRHARILARVFGVRSEDRVGGEGKDAVWEFLVGCQLGKILSQDVG